MAQDAEVLLVCAHAPARRRMRKRLRDAGLRVQAVPTTEDAVRRSQTASTSVWVWDVPASERQPAEVLRRLRASAGLASVPMVLLIPCERQSEAAHLLAHGASDWVAKPVRGAELVARVTGQLGHLAGVGSATDRRSVDAAGGEPVGADQVMDDVLAARLQDQRRFFDAVADGILVVDSHLRIVSCNRSASLLTGYTADQLRELRLEQLAGEASSGALDGILTLLATGRGPASLDIWLQRVDGTSILVSASSSRVPFEPPAVVLTLRDVTSERAVNAELRRTKDFLERVIGSSSAAILSMDYDGMIRLFNRAAERCLGYQAGDVIGKMRAVDLFPPNADPRLLAFLLNPAGDEGSAKKIEDLLAGAVNCLGEVIPVSLSAASIHEEGTCVGAVLMLADMRDRVQMEARLAAAQEELALRERQSVVAELAGAAAHELNQPLTSVMGFTQLLLRKLEPGSATYSAAEVILGQAERMADIVRRIGKITKYETKDYVGAARILDLDRATSDPPPSTRR